MKCNSEYGSDYEKKIAKVLGGTLVPRSGAGPIHKGDILASGFLIDTKWTDKSQFIFKRSEMMELKKYATAVARREGYVVGIGQADYAVIPLDCFVEYLDILRHGVS